MQEFTFDCRSRIHYHTSKGQRLRRPQGSVMILPEITSEDNGDLQVVPGVHRVKDWVWLA